MIRFVQLLPRPPFRHYVALDGGGHVWAQVREFGVTKWRAVELPPDASRITHLAVQPGGGLIVVDREGNAFSQISDGAVLDQSYTWEPIPLPEVA